MANTAKTKSTAKKSKVEAEDTSEDIMDLDDELLAEEEIMENNDAYELFGRNVQAEEKGVLVALQDALGAPTDIKVGLKSFRDAKTRGKYERLRDRLTKLRKKQLRSGDKLTDEDEREINANAFVKSGVLFDLQNMSIHGKDFVFTEQNAIDLLADPTWDVLFARLINMAHALDTFKNAMQEDETKN